MIDFGARLSLKDNMYATLQKNLKIQKEFSKQVKDTDKNIQELGKKNANPVIRLRDNVTGSLMGIKRELRAMSDVKSLSKIEVEDEATRKVEEINKRIKNLHKTVASPFIKLRENVTSKTDNIKQKLKQIATTYTPIVKIRDLASQGLSKIKNTLNWLKVATITPLIMLKDRATAGINKVRVALKTVGKVVSKPFINLNDKASPVINRMKNALKTVGKTVAKPLIAIKDGASKVISGVWGGLKKIGSASVKAMVAVKDGATAGLSKIKNMLGTLAKGATIAIGIAGAGAGLLIGKSLGEGANLEQSIGGVETLFKGDAGTVKANADKAFKTAGLSANAYMETVTGFSASLLGSLGGDTAKSAKVADMAIIDMSDNANKMGTSMDAIQNAYSGFAKQNYTMLDNLKLGYGGTQEEMTRLLTDATKISGVKYNMSNLSDVYNAIHVIQGNLGITGTTAKEASETFSGSFASMKASAQNLLGNLAIGGDVTSSMEQLVDTASTFLFDNAIPMIGRVITALPSAISTGISKASPKIKEAGGAIIKSLKEGMVSILPSSMGGLVDPLFNGIGTGVKGAIGGIKSLVSGLVPVITNLITTMAPVVGEIGAMFERVAPVVQSALSGAFSGSDGFIEGFASVVQSAIPVVEGIISNMAQVIGAVLPTIFPIIQSLGQVFIGVMPIVSNLITIFSQIIQTVFPIISNVINMVLQSVMPIITAFAGLIQSAMPIVEGIIQTFSNVVATIFPVVQTIFQGLGDKIAQIVGVVTSHMGLVQGIFETVAPILQNAIEIVASVLSSAWSIISPIMDLAIQIFDALLTCVEAVFPTIQSVVQSVWDVLSGIFEGIANGLGKVGDAISGVADFVGNGIDTIGGWFGFAYGKDRVPYDNYPAVLHQGEKVLTRNQADQYERSMSTRGVKLSAEVKSITGGTGSTGDTGGGGETQEISKAKAGATTVHIDKLADTVVIQKEADVDKVVKDMVTKFEKLLPTMP